MKNRGIHTVNFSQSLLSSMLTSEMALVKCNRRATIITAARRIGAKVATKQISPNLFLIRKEY